MAFVRFGIATLIAVTSAAPGAAAEPSAGNEALITRLRAGYAKAQQRDCRASLEILTPTLESAEFRKLSEPARAEVYGLASNCALIEQNSKAAYRHAMSGTTLKGAAKDLWKIRFQIEATDARWAAAVATIEAMASQNAAALNAIPMRHLFSLNRELKQQQDGALRRRFLAVVAAPSFEPDEVLATNDAFKRDYAVLLAEAGDRTAAAALVAKIEEPGALIGISVDSRLRAMLPADFDGRAATEQRLAKAREVAGSHPGSMAAVLAVAQYLRRLGRIDEALATLEAARPDGPQGPAFTDLVEQRNWWWDAMAINYERLGRYQEAVAAMKKGSGTNEFGRPNVSQTLNLAIAQLRFGHPDDALTTVAPFDSTKLSMSPYGMMVLSDVRVCAHAALGHTAAVKAEVAYAMAHEQDSPDGLIEHLLCAGDPDQAAERLIRRLEDPDRRAAALLLLSDYDPPPVTYPRSPSAVALAAVKGRPDVRAAIAHAGGARRFRVQEE